jgi:hypothetical protein
MTSVLLLAALLFGAKAPDAMRNGTESGLQVHPPFSIFDPLDSIRP